ncbi:MAG: selenoprotein O [Rhizobiales bacterium]|mgnify:CR=1 FL=1|nr:selenoprotein O [Hyphomicrobiales bacterium]MBA70955.1 selenoprotein O [Hyphomicrobiales bacterium]
MTDPFTPHAEQAAYRPDVQHTRLGSEFYDPVKPAEFPSLDLRFRNDRAAAEIGLDGLSDEEWLCHFGRFQPLPDNLPAPLALRYHGHQFRVYNPDIGDGRGFLFAQMRDRSGRLMDLGTKGSGTTPWSRGGDGRLTLKGGVREVLATELLEALGVNTSRSLSLIETGESLVRGDEPSPTRSSVLVRLNHSHIRIGTFQRLLFLEDHESIRRLLDYSIAEYWPDATGPADFLGHVVDAVARLGAQWFAAGFVHGVLNTDNITVTGESFDYGPWRFLPVLDPNFTAAYFDHQGLYAFGRQPDALYWNLARLGECLIPLCDVSELQPMLETFPAKFDEALADSTFGRLGLLRDESDPERDHRLVALFYGALRQSGAGFERAFLDMMGGAMETRLEQSPHADLYAGEVWRATISAIRDRAPMNGVAEAMASPNFPAQPQTMLIDEVEQIWRAIAEEDDWSAFKSKIDAVREYGRELCRSRPKEDQSQTVSPQGQNG